MRPGHVVGLTLLAFTANARANVSASSQPASPAGAVSVSPTPIEVRAERLEIDCDRARQCRFRAHYELFNPASTPARALVAFWGDAENVTMAPGAGAGRTLSSEERDAMARALRELQPVPEHLMPQEVGADLALAARSFGTLTVRGVLNTGFSGGRGYVTDAVYARHHWLQPSQPRSTHLLASYYLAPIRSFARVGPITIVVRHPSATPEATLVQSDGRVVPLALRETRAGEHVAVISADRAEFLHLSFDDTPSGPHPGGPFAAIGGAFGEGFRVRAGYEFAAPSWLFYGVSAETDGGELLQLTPGLEAVTPWPLLLPWVGIGAAAAFRFEPETRVGPRFSASLGFGSVGAVTSFDWFPKTSTRSAHTEWALLGTVWL